uniref:DNA REPAIR PROTEIN RECN n=1 Tax=Deinococcus radiodurans (strain ATCC 13939 / DSM 20539 / JCM 16871 / CCUG 27074 / LMG 4051 / NBRC 15346 / NCIMB 9279 / VKM B-1422 / R1) TaxID=243230 RepID=UPI0002A1152D
GIDPFTMTRKARTPKAAPVPEAVAVVEPPPPDAAPTGPRLSRLEIRNLATITQLELELGGGFCAFTGETGAGKSIIVDALGLLLGGRANHDLIRSGEKELLVTGFWGDGDESEADSASRRLSSAGRGAARLSGEVVSVRELQEWAQGRLTIHWQHSAVSLLSPANQRGLLDRRVTKEAQAYAAAHAAWREAVSRLERLQASESSKHPTSLVPRGSVDALHAELLKVGQALDAAREREAEPLVDSLLAVIRELGMPHARMEFALSALAEPAAYGLSDVLLRFSANPGEELGPLSDVASGGELSRVMLAVSTVLGADTPSVVFDEVDAGIGGAAAIAVAEQLSRLADTRQVLVVTHLAQIAARAHHHYKVEKQVEDGRTVSHVRLLTGDERLEEIARMLSGNTSEAALEHARELLAG